MIVVIKAKINDFDSLNKKIADGEINWGFDNDDEIIDRLMEVIKDEKKGVVRKALDIIKKLGKGIFGQLSTVLSSLKVSNRAYTKFLVSNWLESSIKKYMIACRNSGATSGGYEILEHEGSYLDGDDFGPENVERKVKLDEDFKMRAFDITDKEALDAKQREYEEQGGTVAFISSIGKWVTEQAMGAINGILAPLSQYEMVASMFLSYINFEPYLVESGLKGEIDISISLDN